MPWSFYVIACFLLGFRFTTLYAETIVISSDVKDVWIGKQLELLKDASPSLTLDAIRSGRHESEFFRIPRDIPTLGYFAGNSYWARFTLQNPTDQPIELYLISRYATTDYLTLYWPDSGDRYASLTLGDCVAFDKRPLEHHFPIFPITVPPGTHAYYLHMQTTTSVLFALSIWTPRNFQKP